MNKGRKKNSAFNEKGSITLSFCLIMPLIFSILLTIFSFNQKQRKELDFARSVAANLEANLACYDRSLWQEFGLLANNQASFSHISPLRYDHENEILLQGEISLYQGEVLREQILRQMKLRFPAEAVIEAANRITGLNSDEGGIEKSLKQIFLEDGYKEAQDYLQPEDLPLAADHGEELDEYLATEIDLLYEDIASSLMPVHIYDEKGDITQGGKADFFDPASMTRLAAFFDNVLQAPQSSPLDKIYLSSYVLDYFPAAVAGRIISGQKISRKTPDGRVHADLIVKRRGEVEEIICGKRAQEAVREVESRLILLRSIVQIIHKFQDQGLRSRYKITAAIISGAVAILSLGSVSIPPEPIEYLLILSAAAVDGRREAKRLMDGHGVPFWPDWRTNLYYHDYLFMMLLALDANKILENSAHVISRHHPGPGWVQLKASAAMEGKSLNFSAGYLENDYFDLEEGMAGK